MPALTISKLANAADVGVETVRYYQRRGLLDTPDRPYGGIRRYHEEDVARLRFIRSAQTAGFTLAEIGRLLDLDRNADRAAIRAIADERVAALDRQIADLNASRAALVRLSGQCRHQTGGACPIIEAFADPA